MLVRRIVPCLALCQVLGLGAAGLLQAQKLPRASSPVSTDGARSIEGELTGAGWSEAAEMLLASVQSALLRDLINEVLERNPEIARAERLAIAAELKAPQVRALPDPVAALSFFALSPETRTGPQRLSVSIRQKFPWFGKLALREKVALYKAAAAWAEVERIRLNKLTETRKLAHRLAFLDAYEAVVSGERITLVRYEKAAQARYAAGTGLQQGIVRIQAQITRTDTRLLEISERRVALFAQLNRLRDRPAATRVGSLDANDPGQPLFDIEALLRMADSHRPELAAAEARIAAGTALVALAEKNFRPDVTLGLSYTAVGGREDLPGRLNPPEDDGDDILALTGSLNLPVRRKKLEAGLHEATASRWAAEEAKRAVRADIDSTIGDLGARMPLLFEHLTLLETVLRKQAREALRSAETAYSTGKLNAVDLLDAEVVLFEVQIAAARTRADLAVAWADLERAVGQPIESFSREHNHER